jgi:hypothetical protein
LGKDKAKSRSLIMPGKRTKPAIINAIIAIHNANPEMDEKGIRKVLRSRGIKEGSIPKADKTIRKYMENDKKFKFTEKDKFWSLYASIEYNLPYDIDQLLLEVTISYDNIPPTIRVARWIARLYPLIKEELINLYPDRENQIDRLMTIALTYAYHEQLAEAKKGDYDTYDLDKKYLIEKDINYNFNFPE